MQAIPFLVLGDVMIDNYYHGSVQRISPEAPVPVVKVNAVKKYPGGAGNVVSNLAGLGAQLSLIAGIGDDEDGRWLAHHYKEKSLNFLPLIWDKPTIIKSRILGGRQQILRFDREEAGDLTAQEEDQLLGRLQDFDSHGIQGIVLSDYNKGFCTPKICQWVIKMAQEKQIPVFVDPKGNTWDKYTGAFLVTPNLSELSLVYGETVPNQNQAVVEAGQFLLQKYQLNNLLITRSEMGMTLIQKDSVNHFPTEAQEVYDVSGAGDTVIATVSYLLASGMDPEEAVRLANQAAGIAVAHSGTWSIDALTLSRLMHQNFHGSLDAKALAQSLKSQGKRIVFTNGCFDILHSGHIQYLRKTAELGDVLIVGLNSDESVKRLKGPLRPVNPQEARATVLEALEMVDHVVIFEEDTPYELIKAIEPDVLTKGGDYTPETVVGREFAQETVIISFLEGYSTTKTIEKMNNHG